MRRIGVDENWRSGSLSVSARVLVVEDDPETRLALAEVLAQSGYSITQASGGSDAVRSVLDERPDVVVLDLRLPDAHGVEVAGAIRAMAGSTRMPIVVVTGHTDAAEQLDPKRFDAECVLIKPVRDEDLLAAVARCLASPPPGPEEAA